MLPWGKSSSEFTEYEGIAACDTLAEIDLDWRPIQLVTGADTIHSEYLGSVAVATFAQKLGWNDVPASSSYATYGQRFADTAKCVGSDPDCFLQRRYWPSAPIPSRRAFCTNRRQAPQRSELTAIPSHWGYQRCISRCSCGGGWHGSVRGHARRLRAGEGQEFPVIAHRIPMSNSAKRHWSTMYWPAQWRPIRCNCWISTLPLATQRH